MPVFRRRNETSLERELSATRERRDKLKGQRIDAQRALDLAIAERRRTQVEADADDGRIAKDIVRNARDLGSSWIFCENPNGTCGASLENLATVRLQS